MKFIIMRFGIVVFKLIKKQVIRLHGCNAMFTMYRRTGSTGDKAVFGQPWDQDRSK